jgi:transcriptional regulator with XRE-family HTH domain
MCIACEQLSTFGTDFGARFCTRQVEKSKYLRLLGQRLAEERARLGLTQAEVADFAGVTRRTQINYEGGERAPDAAYFKTLEKRGVDALYVIAGRREAANEPTSGAASGAVSARELRVAESNGIYHVAGLKAANVRAAAIAVFEAAFAMRDETTRTSNAKKNAQDAARVAEAIVVLANMSENVEDVRRNATHVLQLLK